jgi:hypothetical protein
MDPWAKHESSMDDSGVMDELLQARNLPLAEHSCSPTNIDQTQNPIFKLPPPFFPGTIADFRAGMAKKFAYLTMAVIVLIYIQRKVNARRCLCFCGQNYATISTVTRENFIETIPQSGKLIDGKLIVQIDKLYRPKIKTGLKATANINNADIRFRIWQVDTTITNGRFSVVMDFADTVVAHFRDQSVRLRIELSEERVATVVPVGGFYVDTGGKWIYVMTDENHFVKRNIKLGAKNPNHFTVLEGLQPGEKVLTSSYDNFAPKENVSMWQIEQKKPLRLM